MDTKKIFRFESLPPEVQLVVFERLDFHSRINCSLVCKQWNRLAMSGTFFNDHVLMKLEVDCDCTLTPKRTVRNVACVLLGSSRKYRAVSMTYMHGTQLGVNSMLNLCRQFDEVTHLRFEQKYQRIHPGFLRQIIERCPRLKSLRLNVLFVSSKLPPSDCRTLDTGIEELILAEPTLGDFFVLIQMFANVPKLCLQNVRIKAEYVDILALMMPRLESLKFHGLYINGFHPLRGIKLIVGLRELTISASIFSKEFSKWPKLPLGVKRVSITHCGNVQMLNQIRDRWSHATVMLAGNNCQRYVGQFRIRSILFSVIFL